MLTIQEAKKILKKINFPNMVFELKPISPFETYFGYAVELIILHKVVDANPPHFPIRVFHSFQIKPFAMTREDLFIKEIFNCICLRQVHEVCEFFMFDGKRVFDPHEV